jgi:cell division protein FtsQ
MKLYLKILIALLWTGLVSGAIVLAGFAGSSHRNKYCSGVNVDITHQGDELITPGIVKDELKSRYGNFADKYLKEIDIKDITAFIRKNPYVEDANINLGVEGVLFVRINQRQPVIRVFNNLGQQFYIDSKGYMIPVTNQYPAHVVVASGNIAMPFKARQSIFNRGNSAKAAESLIKAHYVAKAIANDTMAKAAIEQIFTDASGCIKLISKVGKHVILLGDTTDTKEKLDNLFSFYRFGLTKTGWDKYHILDLRFKNQVVCKK